MKTKFKKGDVVDFKRNSTVKKNGATILGIVKMQNGEKSRYVIEYADGITPDVRMEEFGLNKDKKYTFVSEGELSEKKSEKKRPVGKILVKNGKKVKKYKR